MPQMTLNRNRTLSTLVGHRIYFEKDVPTNVPSICVPDALEIGALFVDEADAPKDRDDEAPEQKDPMVELRAAFDDIVGRNDPDDFTAAGIPKASAVKEITGMRFQAKDVAKHYDVYRQELKGGDQ